MKEILENMVQQGWVIFLGSHNKDGVLRELVDLLASSPAIEDREDLISSLIEREEIMSTGIGYGIAVPHVKINTVRDTVIALGVHREGVDWGTLVDDQPVQIVVLIAAPETKTKEYLQLLAKVMEILKDRDVRDQIISSDGQSQVIQMIENRLAE